MRADARTMLKDNAKLDLLTRPPRGMPTASIPDKGPGRSEGPNTYRRITNAAYTVRACTPAVAGPCSTPAVAGPDMPLPTMLQAPWKSPSPMNL